MRSRERGGAWRIDLVGASLSRLRADADFSQTFAETYGLEDGLSSRFTLRMGELVEILPAETRPFEPVRPQVERELRTQRGAQDFQQLLDGLRAQAQIEIDEAALRALPADAALLTRAAAPTRPARLRSAPGSR